jgi:hypothetical protein
MLSSESLEGTLHDPDDREAVGILGPWEIRRHADHDLRLYWLARHRGLHVQLWHGPSATSVISPSALTRGRWEVRRPGEPVRRLATFDQVRAALEGLPFLCPCCMQRVLDLWVGRTLKLLLLHGGVGAPGRAFPEC